MTKVHLLDELTAHQIAAGEVIERPASVVKELVENALDAGAVNIDVEIADGGLKRIRVSDDGAGMSGEDAHLAVKRHATSKIRSLSDLDHIRTLGFRGEALPSIASVSKLEIVTREADCTFGTRLVLEGGDLLTAEPAGAPGGTSVSVGDLFYNTPARKKFMRSHGYEGGLIHELLIHYSLSHPEVNFRLIHRGKEVLNTKGIDTLPDLIGLFYGKDVKGNLYYIENGLAAGTIKAFLTLPTVHRANRKGIHFFVNSRRVMAKELAAALEGAYEDTMPGGRFPVAVINMNISPALLDVNVHPSKLEIRFRDHSFINELAALIRENLRNKKHSLAYRLVPPEPDTGQEKQRMLYRGNSSPGAVQEGFPGFNAWETGYTYPREAATENESDVFNITRYKDPKAGSDDEAPSAAKHDCERTNFEPPGEDNLPALRVIGQLHASFILAEGEDGLYLIDQHAAHERVLFDRLMNQANRGAVESQLLLIPLSIELTALEEEVALENIIPLSDMGIILEHFGPRSYLLRAVPTGLAGDPLDFFYTLLERFSRAGTQLSPADIRKEFLITLSCKSAVKAGQELPPAAQLKLIRDLNDTAHALTCPHGRPTVFHITLREIMRAFRRQ